MKISNNNCLLLMVIVLFTCSNIFGQKLLDNHIEAVEQFSRVKSKSKSLVSYAKRSMAGQTALDSVELMYLGGSLIKEISIMQKSKKDNVKKELDQYKLDDWIEIQ